MLEGKKQLPVVTFCPARSISGDRRLGRYRIKCCSAAWLAVLFAAIAIPAQARPPVGTDLKSDEHAWWECNVQPVTNVVCCRESDGHVLSDGEWRATEKPEGGRVYQVRVNSRWYDVPEGALINDFRKCGPEPNTAKQAMAKVWYAPVWNGQSIVDIKIYCFIAGTMY